MSSKLVEFLLARIAEDEAVARSAEPTWPGEEGLMVREWEADGTDVILLPPTRLLAECEAKRRIVTGLSAVLAQSGNPQQRQNAGATLGHLAAVYADHPDYREEWRS